MKKLLALFLLILPALPLFAALSLSAELGLAVNRPIGDPGYGYGSYYSPAIGVDAAALCRWDFASPFGLETGLRFRDKGFMYTRESEVPGNDSLMMEETVSTLTLEVPLLATYTYSNNILSLSGGLGGYTAWKAYRWTRGRLYSGFEQGYVGLSSSGFEWMDERWEAGLAAKASMLFNLGGSFDLGASLYTTLALTPTEKVYQWNQEMAMDLSFSFTLAAAWRLGGET